MEHNNLVKIREKFDLSQDDIAKICGCSKTLVFLWENDFTKIRSNYLLKLSHHFKVTTDYLLDNENKEYKLNEIINEVKKLDANEIKEFIIQKIKEAYINEDSLNDK